MPLALKVFCDKTRAAVSEKDVDSAYFIECCTQFFTICNNRKVGEDIYRRNPAAAEIRNISQLSWLQKFCCAMQNSDLSIDTKRALNRYSANISTLCSQLLGYPEYKFALLGRYQSDDFE